MKRLLLALTAVSLASSVTAQDWKGIGRMTGKVLGDGGQPVAGATVKFDCPVLGGGPSVTTNDKGAWSYLGLAGCDWNILVSAEGYNAMAIVVNLPNQQVRQPPVNVTLERPAGPPPELVALVKKGDDAFNAQDWTTARQSYEQIIEKWPDVAVQMYPKLARTFVGEGNHAKAVEFLEKSIASDPTRLDFRFAAAQAALDAGLKEKGMEFLAAIDDAAVTTADGYFNVAVSFLRASDFKNAIDFFSKAISKDEKLGDAYYWRGMCYVSETKLDEARVDMQKVLDLNPAGQYAQKARDILDQLKGVSPS